MEEILAVVGLFLLRLGVPLAITLAVGYWLRRLDAKWEAEALRQWAEEEPPEALKALDKAEQPCWELKGCNGASRAKCPACKYSDIPCWVARLRASGQMPAECYGCELFSLSPA
jgi:hypothetical protein